MSSSMEHLSSILKRAQLARNIAATIHGEPTHPFRYRTLGQMATLGHHKGVGVIGPLQVSGFLAWFLWRTYYLARLPRIEKRLRMTMDGTVDLLYDRDISQIQTCISSRAGDRQQSQQPEAGGGGRVALARPPPQAGADVRGVRLQGGADQQHLLWVVGLAGQLHQPGAHGVVVGQRQTPVARRAHIAPGLIDVA